MVQPIIFDGFDLYNGVGATTGVKLRWTQTGTDDVAAMIAGRHGGQALRLGDNIGTGQFTNYRSPAFTPIQNFSWGFSYKSNSLTLGDGAIFASLNDSANAVQLYFTVTSAGAISVRRADGSVMAFSANGLVSVGVWKHLEIIGKIANADGFIRAYLEGNDVPILSFDGDTQHTANANAMTVNFRGPASTSDTHRLDWDDFYLYDEAVQHGYKIISTLRPDGDTATLQLTPSAGTTHFDKVNETTFDNVDWLTGSTVGLRDQLTLSALPLDALSVAAVQTVSYAAKTDATAREIKSGLRESGAEVFGPNHVLATTPSVRHNIIPNNPSTGLPWTYDQVNAMDFLPEIAV